MKPIELQAKEVAKLLVRTIFRPPPTPNIMTQQDIADSIARALEQFANVILDQKKNK